MEDQAQQHNSFPPRVPHTPPMEEDEPFTLLETPRRFQELFSLEDVGTGALHDETAVRSSSGGSSTSDSHTEEETEGAEKRRRAAWDDSGVSTSDSEWGTSEPEEHREEHADGESPPARRDGRRSRWVAYSDEKVAP
jgi:hypothetical protein